MKRIKVFPVNGDYYGPAAKKHLKRRRSKLIRAQFKRYGENAAIKGVWGY